MRVLLVLLLVFSLVACDSTDTYGPKIKPSNIPDTAFWVGGADGGAYIEIKPNKEVRNKYYAKIYFDSTGEIWYEGWLIYSGKETLNINDKNIYSLWDGDTLYLVDNKFLTIEEK